MKQCVRCKEIKLLDDFNNSKAAKDGISGTCKKCDAYLSSIRRLIKRNESYRIHLEERKKIAVEFYSSSRYSQEELTNRLEFDVYQYFMEIDILDKLFCKKCNQWEFYWNFPLANNTKSGYQSVCKNCWYQRSANWEDENRDQVNENTRNRRQSNLEKVRVYQKNWMKNKYKTDPIYRIKSHIHVRMWYALFGQIERQHKRLEELLGYSIRNLKTHLEVQFLPGMTWENHGDWHIDHKRPISSFNLYSYTCPDFKDCWKLDNLQPLWAKDNLSKYNKWDNDIV